MSMDLASINYLSVLIGGLVYILYGGIYYSIAVSNKKESNKSILGQQSRGLLKYLYSVILAFAGSFFMAVLIQAMALEAAGAGALIGFLVGLLISLLYLKNMLFGLLNKQSYLIAVGDHLIAFTLLGFIHGLFI